MRFKESKKQASESGELKRNYPRGYPSGWGTEGWGSNHGTSVNL